jgi:BirA family biotin operon repressor/biotin-[acetyl-CoA-carboxylase] ligase
MKWIKLDSVDSTNSYVSGQLRSGEAVEEMVVIADFQESGKGQGDHKWESQRGKNLLMSVLLYPVFLSASEQFHLTRLASLAICDFLDPLGLDTLIKWPNDVLTSGGKIAGILIENGITGKSISHTIMGIGINLNQGQFPEYPVRATSLFMERGITLEPGFAAESVMEHLEVRYRNLEKGTAEQLEEEYLDRLYGLGQELLFSTGGRTFPGIIRGVSEFGELLVESEGVTGTFGFQQIETVPSTQ